MSVPYDDLIKLIDVVRSAYADSEPERIVMKATRYREWLHMQELWKRGKPWIRAHHMRRKSLERMPSAIREEARILRHRSRRSRTPIVVSKGWYI
jgi:hypothetical protein